MRRGAAVLLILVNSLAVPELMGTPGEPGTYLNTRPGTLCAEKSED